MVCDALRNLLVTGRCVSATFEAGGRHHTTPTVGAWGQAAGTAAATFAAAGGGDVRTVDIPTPARCPLTAGRLAGRGVNRSFDGAAAWE